MNGVFKDVPEKLHRKFSEVRQLQTGIKPLVMAVR